LSTSARSFAKECFQKFDESFPHLLGTAIPPAALGMTMRSALPAGRGTSPFTKTSSIMDSNHESMDARHVQAKLSPAEYEAVAAAARKAHMTLQEAVRGAVLRWAESRGTYRDPFDDFIGSVDLGIPDASERVDEIVYGDPHGEQRKRR